MEKANFSQFLKNLHAVKNRDPTVAQLKKKQKTYALLIFHTIISYLSS